MALLTRHLKNASSSRRPSRTRRWSRLGPALLLLLAMAILFSLAADATWARAGGGGGFGGGGGGGGGFGGGGGGFGGGYHGTGRGGRTSPGMVLFVVGVWAVIAIVGASARRKQNDRTIVRGVQAFNQNRRDRCIDALKQRDASFDPAAFLQRFGKAFMKIQHAWCNQVLTTVRPFISDGIYERFSLQIDEQKALGYRDHMENITIHFADIEQIVPTGPFDILTVRVRASAVDYRQDLRTGKRISGATSAESFTEFWSFVRRPDAVTKTGQAGLMEGNCPNCGAGVGINQAADCEHCGAALRSGVYDWVLSEITQAGEWRAERQVSPPGVGELRQRDRGFTIQHLEDRASVMFWRRATAARLGRIEPLRKIATEEYCQTLLKSLAVGQDSRTWTGDCAVGSVDTLGILLAEEDEPFDRALMAIRWAGVRYQSERGNPAGAPVGERALHHSLFVLGRSRDAKTGVNTAVSSAHCPGCGAPESGGVSNACEYCGEVLNDGTGDWVLMDVLSHAHPRAEALMARVRSRPTGAKGPDSAAVRTPASAGLLAWMIQTVIADGNVDQRERQMLNAAATKLDIDRSTLDAMIASARQGELQPPSPADLEEARAWIAAMASLAMSDGTIHPQEKRLFLETGKRVGLGLYDVNLILRQQRLALLKQGRLELQMQKNKS